MLQLFKIYFLALLVCSTTYVRADREAERDSLRECLHHWKKHPFNEKKFDYRVLSAGVKVFGIGNSAEDGEKTSKPELVLVRPSVSVLSKGSYKLLNPNGWYCLKAKVAVLSKVSIELHCKANLASTIDGATVLVSNKKEDGVTVLGKSEIKRVGCSEDASVN